VVLLVAGVMLRLGQDETNHTDGISLDFLIACLYSSSWEEWATTRL